MGEKAAGTLKLYGRFSSEDGDTILTLFFFLLVFVKGDSGLCPWN